MKKIKVGIIGCGTIGSALAKILVKEFRREAVLAYISELHPEKAKKIQAQLGAKVALVSLGKIIRNSDLVIEAASAAVAGWAAKSALKQNKQILVMSVGGLLDGSDWPALSNRSRGKLWVPSGAIAGIDGLLAAKESGLRSVKLITKKPPQSLRTAPYFINRKFPVLQGQKEYCIFKGTAQQAVKAFPQNINVAAVLSLAGMGSEKTRVEIWTSRVYRLNQHQVIFEGDFGKIETCTQNKPSPENPKTSALAIYSAAAALRKIFSSFRIGT